MPDRNAQKAQIEQVLKARYFPFILQLPINQLPEQHEKNRLSRSLAAFTIEKMADLSPAQSANAVFDGGNDCGIDAVHFDRTENLLWVVQSKSGGAPDQGENLKFCNGIRNLITGQFGGFNQNFVRLQPEVEDALETAGLKLIACDAHLGEGLGPHAIADLDQLKTELNQFVERFSWRDLNVHEIHRLLTAEHIVLPIDVTMTIERWFGIDQPRKAFYGLVTAEQLSTLYETHGKSLFEKNIRHYLGGQTVNLAIAETVENHPGDLFFLNNGLTAVCATITPLPGATNQRGTFSLTGFSVVNGAQTVGSIATVKRATGAISPDAKVMITLIEVGNEEENIGAAITRARNTQNAVRGLYFAALDPQQERLRQELAISGIDYYYRPSAEALRGGPNVITLEKAAIALACFSGSIRTIVALKKESGQVYDVNGPYYSTLFAETLSGVRLCRYVRIFDYLNAILNSSEMAEDETFRRAFYRHGRFFIMCILARRYHNVLLKPEIQLSTQDQIDLSRAALELAESIYSVAEARFNRYKGYLSVFRNSTDSEPLAQEVMLKLAQQDAAAIPTPNPLPNQQPNNEVQP